jgi:phospholipase C
VGRATGFLAVVLYTLLMVTPAVAAPSHFKHIVILVQENRTPDNLFYAICSARPCSTHPDSSTYDIQLDNWLDRHANGGTTNPTALPLATAFSPYHAHEDFVAMCDYDAALGGCRMDGAGDVRCKPHCPANTPFTYVDNSRGLLAPYLFLAENYGWANYMFQTNQGPSFPAHQFLFGATSAPSSGADHKGTFAAENAQHNNEINGCIAPAGSTVALINADGVEYKNTYPCYEHQTLGDLLDADKVSWRYYTPGAGDLWSAPDAIQHICEPDNGVCTGSIWQKHLALEPTLVLTDIKACNLPAVSWVIPSRQYSDHARTNYAGGPAWVATVINAIGNSACKNGDGTSYWDSTAILVTWDDWGGFYDHEPPTFLPYPEGGYQYGFRVPLLFVSAYTPVGYINNERQDFGSILRFVEFNYGITMGALSFADARSTRNFAHFYDLSATPREFQAVPGSLSPQSFLIGKDMPLEAPDDD